MTEHHADEHAPVRCLVFAGRPDLDQLAAATGLTVHAWSLLIDDHLIRGTD